jgi:hypothetical protein
LNTSSNIDSKEKNKERRIISGFCGGIGGICIKSDLKIPPIMIASNLLGPTVLAYEQLNPCNNRHVACEKKL